MTHVHLIGIGGSGLSAIARFLLESGETVSGSDRQMTPLLDSLRLAGAQIYIGHAAQNVASAEVVVRSSAVPDENVEVQAARKAGIPVLKRADFLDRLVADRRLIAVAGTHGKTTTTAMLAWMLTALHLDPSYIIGSIPSDLGSNAHAGRGDLFVLEADEYDRMFLALRPHLAVITNVEHDHPDCYPTAEDFYQAFVHFARQVAADGYLLACGDDAGARRLLTQLAADGRRVRAYRLHPASPQADADYWAARLRPNTFGGFTFTAYARSSTVRPGRRLARLALRVPGRHNVSNALAALAVADLLALPIKEAAAALSAYRGASRRFELRGETGGVVVIDDYAHHPTEIKATLAAARARFPQRRIWAVWQPHTYSRTRLLFNEFAASFEDADVVLVTEVYAARELPPQDGFTARQLVAAMSHPAAFFIPQWREAADFLLHRLQPGDVLLVLSAGDAHQISAQVLEGLKAVNVS